MAETSWEKAMRERPLHGSTFDTSESAFEAAAKSAEESKARRSPEVQAQIDAARSDDERRAGVDAYCAARKRADDLDRSSIDDAVVAQMEDPPGHNAVADLGFEDAYRAFDGIDHRPSIVGLPKEPSAILVGAELAAYQRLHAASKAAQVAQDAIATTGAELRDAIQGLCAILGRK